MDAFGEQARGVVRKGKRKRRDSPDGIRDPAGSSTQRNGMAPIYGALDLGTNNCRLLVARPAPWGFRVVDAFSRIVRLGEGLQRTGELSKPAMARAIEALKICTDKMIRRDVMRSRLIATEACRQAANGAEFIENVRQETGLKLEVINRETEAQLAVAGSAALLDPQCENAIVFDIGGGSSELMWLSVNGEKHEIEAWTSLPIGVVTLAEKFGGVDVTRDVFDAMVAEVSPLLMNFEQQHGICQHFSSRPSHMLGTSGTVTTIAGVHLGLRRYERSKVDGCWLETHDISNVTGDLLHMTYDERASSPCIGKDRADLVLAGCAILEAIRSIWPCSRVRVADRGLREGILTKLMIEDGVYATQRSDTRSSIGTKDKAPRRRRRNRRRQAKTVDQA